MIYTLPPLSYNPKQLYDLISPPFFRIVKSEHHYPVRHATSVFSFIFFSFQEKAKILQDKTQLKEIKLIKNISKRNADRLALASGCTIFSSSVAPLSCGIDSSKRDIWIPNSMDATAPSLPLSFWCSAAVLADPGSECDVVSHLTLADVHEMLEWLGETLR